MVRKYKKKTKDLKSYGSEAIKGGTGCSFLCFLCSVLSIIVYLFASFLYLRLMASDNLCQLQNFHIINSTNILLKSH